MCDKTKCSCKLKNPKRADVSETKLKEIEDAYSKLQSVQSRSLLKKHLTPQIFNLIKKRTTTYGSCLLDLIQSGVKNPDSGIGVYASDPEAYEIFAPLLNPIIEEYHSFSIERNHPNQHWGDSRCLKNLDPHNKYIISTRVRCARSIDGYCFNPKMTIHDYCIIQSRLMKRFESFKSDLEGKYYLLANMSDDTKQQLTDDHFLFAEGDRFLKDARACEFWPHGRGIFYNTQKTLLAWVNEEDHLRLISMQPGGDLAAVYKRLIRAMQKLEEMPTQGQCDFTRNKTKGELDSELQIKWARSEHFGYLTFCPTNLGTTIRASVHIRLPKLSRNYDEFVRIAGSHNLQVRGTGGEHTKSTGGIYDISNKRRLGLTEFEVINEMSDGITNLIKEEESL